jgi:hypothetical protein
MRLQVLRQVRVSLFADAAWIPSHRLLFFLCCAAAIAQLQAAMIHTPDTKQGVKLALTAINPVTGKHLPVYAAPYVLSSFGSGAVMGPCFITWHS